MKNYSKVLGIIALVAVIGLSMTACSILGGDKGGGFGAPGAPSIKKLPSITDLGGTAAVTSESEALDLWQDALYTDGNYFSGIITAARTKAYEDAFQKQYGTTLSSSSYKSGERATKNSVSYSVKVKGDVTIDTTTPATVINIDGTYKNSESTNKASLLAYDILSTYSKGDAYSVTSSTKATYFIKDSTTYVAGYKIGGYYVVDYKYSDKEVVTEPSSTTTYLRENEDQKTTGKYSYALTIVDTATGKGAKFRYSSAYQQTKKERKSTTDTKNADSYLEVYGLTDNLLFSIQY